MILGLGEVQVEADTIGVTIDKITKTIVAMDMTIVIRPISMQCEVEPATVVQVVIVVAAMEIVTIHTIHIMMVILF